MKTTSVREALKLMIESCHSLLFYLVSTVNSGNTDYFQKSSSLTIFFWGALYIYKNLWEGVIIYHFIVHNKSEFNLILCKTHIYLSMLQPKMIIIGGGGNIVTPPPSFHPTWFFVFIFISLFHVLHLITTISEVKKLCKQTIFLSYIFLHFSLRDQKRNI